MSEYIIKLPNGGAADECIRLRGYEKSLYGYELHEEIVRCGDCVHAEPEREPPRKGCKGLLWCDYLTEGIGFSVLPHNFCAWGERGDV